MFASRPMISGLPRYALALFAALALLTQAFLGNAAGGSAMAHGFDPANVLCVTGENGTAPLPGAPHPADCLCPAACHAAASPALALSAPPAATSPRLAVRLAWQASQEASLIPFDAPATSARGPPLQA